MMMCTFGEYRCQVLALAAAGSNVMNEPFARNDQYSYWIHDPAWIISAHFPVALAPVAQVPAIVPVVIVALAAYVMSVSPF